ncbi:hypothetical protein [Aurantibacter sp.]|uniref:hypothetical protein n=1 Tax=Aurantibacter sp. TaxID=2807103 RepID=UPI003262FE8C
MNLIIGKLNTKALIKKYLLVLSIIFLLSCSTKNTSVDYFCQAEPDITPTLFAPDFISVKGRFEHGISFTPDTQELAFGILNKNDFSGEIRYSKKVNNTWNTPESFEPLKNKSVYLPYFSPNGTSMLFAQNKSNTNNGITDIWMLAKNNNVWEQPKKVIGAINSSARESMASMTMDNKIYFSSNRDGNGLADLYFANSENGKYSTVERLDSICTLGDEESIFIAADESYLIFSRYASNDNGPDLFISYRDNKGKWMAPTILNTKINTANWERRPFVSIDNNFLFYTKLTFDAKGLVESDIYWVSTKKVFSPYVFNEISDLTIKSGTESKTTIPTDYFKDIDSEKLKLSINQKELNWISFDEDKMVLTMFPTNAGTYELKFTAMDNYLNSTMSSVKIIVEE